jgi:hypothetical protein
MARAKKTAKKTRPLEYAGNLWHGCVGANEGRIDRLESEIDREIPSDVRELLRTCAGGAPELSFFESRKHDIEVGIGHVLMLDPGKTKKQSVADAMKWISKDSARKNTSADDIVPFAVDNGNANFLCTDEDGRVVYRILHEPAENERRVVADSLKEFLDGLEEPP